MKGTYLLHIDPPFKHAKHYCGCSGISVLDRIEVHLTGHGVPLVRAALAAGCEVILVRVWENQGFEFEQHLKQKYKNSPQLCPLCNPTQAQFLYQPKGSP